MFSNFQGERGCENFRRGLKQTPKLYGMPKKIVCDEVFEVMISHACVCGLNNILLIVIMTIILILILKKMTHNFLIF
jgi:hypothetical protein